MLTIIGTPIGNLGDLSLRAAYALADAEVILTEDTRSFDALWRRVIELCDKNEHPIPKKAMIVSYYKEVEFQKLPDIIGWLSEEKNVALVSEAGMPLISDPGQLLISTVRKRNIPCTVIPGPSAVDTALVLSGMKHDQYMFVGFLPRKEAEVKKLMAKLYVVHELLDDTVFIAFDSPERIAASVASIRSAYPNVELVIAREVTKKFEELIIASSPTADLSQIKGECVIVMRFVR